MKKTSKVCSKCGENKPLDEFYKDKSMKDGKKSTCAKCDSDRVRENNFKYRYNITVDEYHEILNQQNSQCPICDTTIYSKDDTPERGVTACVDHCHSTGIIRGLLCRSCNTSLGVFGDNKEGIERALAYVSQTVDIRFRDNGDTKPECGQDTHDRDEGHPKWTQEELLLSVELGGARE